jgi:hypothetical protein
LDESSKSHDIFYSITVCTRDERCAYSCEIVTLLEVPGNICVDVAGLSKPTSELNENSIINCLTMDRIKTYDVIELLLSRALSLRPMMAGKSNFLR